MKLMKGTVLSISAKRYVAVWEEITAPPKQRIMRQKEIGEGLPPATHRILPDPQMLKNFIENQEENI